MNERNNGMGSNCLTCINTYYMGNVHHEWWVMSDTGEPLARINWPRDQSIVLVNDNNLYTRETEKETALQHTARYSIKLTEM